jgi:hypothetical protein
MANFFLHLLLNAENSHKTIGIGKFENSIFLPTRRANYVTIDSDIKKSEIPTSCRTPSPNDHWGFHAHSVRRAYDN